MTIKEILGTKYIDFQEFCFKGDKHFPEDLTASDYVAFRVQYSVSREYVNEIKNILALGLPVIEDIKNAEDSADFIPEESGESVEIGSSVCTESETVYREECCVEVSSGGDETEKRQPVAIKINDTKRHGSLLPFDVHIPLYQIFKLASVEKFRDIKIEALGFKTRVFEILRQDGRRTVADVLLCTPAQIFDFGTIARSSIAKIIAEIKCFVDADANSFEVLIKQTTVPLFQLFKVISPENYSNISIASVGFKIRFINLLEERKIKDIYSLLLLTMDNMIAWEGMGTGTLNHSMRQLYDYLQSEDRKEIKLSDRSNFTKEAIEKIRLLVDKFVLGENVDGLLEQLDEEELALYNKYEDAINICGQEFYASVKESVEYYKQFVKSLRELAKPTLALLEKKQSLYMTYCEISQSLKNKSLKLFVEAYAIKHNNKLKDCFSSCSEDFKISGIWNLINKEDGFLTQYYNYIEEFFIWLKGLDVLKIVNDVFSRDALAGAYKIDEDLKDKYWLALEMRADGATLECVGELIDATRERVRQIEKKYTRNFAIYYQNCEYDLLKVIHSLRSGDNVLKFDEIAEIIGDKHTKLLWLVLIKGLLDCNCYKYSKFYNAVVFTNDAGIERENLKNAMKDAPEFFFAEEFESVLDELVEKYKAQRELLKIDILSQYRLYGKVYSKSYLTVAFICSYILKEKFPNGYKIADESEAKRFQTYQVEIFGEKGKMTPRALDAKIGEIGVLFDRGKYIHSSYITVDKCLFDEVNAYMENSSKNVFTYAELFDAHKHIFEGTQVVNRFILQGVLKLYGCKYSMTRDYVTKETGRSLTDELEGFAKEMGIFHKADFFAAFPAMSDGNLAMLVGRSTSVFSIDNGMYMHSSMLNLCDSDYDEIRQYLDEVCSTAPVNSRYLFDEFSYRFVDFMLRNEINGHTKLFGILYFMFKKEYNFSRPYISKGETELTNRAVILHHLAEVETIAIEELINLCVENGINYYSSGILIRTVSPDYIRVDENLLMRKDLTGITEDVILETTMQVAERVEVDGYCASSTFNDFLFFPSINISWTPYLVEGIINLTNNMLNIVLIPTTTYSTLTHVYVGERYAGDDYQTFLLKVVDEAYSKDFFATKTEMREWLSERGLINYSNLPNFLEGTQYYYTDEKGLLRRR